MDRVEAVEKKLILLLLGVEADASTVQLVSTVTVRTSLFG